jgi:hypothetical protein
MKAIDEQMFFWKGRTGKKIATLLPLAMEFVASMCKPLFEKIDSVHYTQSSRRLKVAAEYGERLLLRNYDARSAEKIAVSLTENYPEHEFVIDLAETARIGLKAEECDQSMWPTMEALALNADDCTSNYIGRLIEGSSHEESKALDGANSATQANGGGSGAGSGNRDGQVGQGDHVGTRDPNGSDKNPALAKG